MYTSLFDIVSVEELIQYQPFQGPLSQVFNELSQPHIPTGQLIYDSARIIHGVINEKIANPSENIEQTLKEAIQFVQETYKYNRVNLSTLEMLQARCKSFITNEVKQEADEAACYSAIGKLSQKTAEYIATKTNNSQILLIPMANGATNIAIDILLRYIELTGQGSSTVYPCRFSRYKSKDSKPQLTDTELEYLKKEAIESEVILFEENVITGNTLYSVIDYFKNVFPEYKHVLPTYNANLMELMKGKSLDSTDHDDLTHDFIELMKENLTS